MRKYLLTCLISCLSLTACADHSGSLDVLDSGPQAPINDPDNNSFQPIPDDSDVIGDDGDNGGSDNELALPGGDNGGSAGTGGGNVGDGSGAQAGHGGNAAEGGGAGGAQEGGSGSQPDAQAGTGGGGQPVPEPSTLLLVGTGLAGAALLRRRRKTPIVEA